MPSRGGLGFVTYALGILTGGLIVAVIGGEGGPWASETTIPSAPGYAVASSSETASTSDPLPTQPVIYVEKMVTPTSTPTRTPGPTMTPRSGPTPPPTPTQAICDPANPVPNQQCRWPTPLPTALPDCRTMTDENAYDDCRWYATPGPQVAGVRRP